MPLVVALAAPLSSQVDPSGTYRTLTSAHFRVHFRPDHRDRAIVATREAERAYAELARELAPPRGTIDMVLADDVDVANAFAQVVPTNRITVLLPPPTREGIADFDDWLRLAIGHELVHIFHLDRARGPWRVAQTVFGRVPGSFPNAYQPSWVTEGLAVYYESRLTAAGRIGSSFHRQVMQGELLAGHERRWQDATYTDIRWPSGNAPYAYGGQFFDQLAQRSAGAAIGDFVEETSGQWIPVRVGWPLSRVAGERLDSAWGSGLDPLRGDGPPSGAPRMLAQDLLASPTIAASADGRLLAYVHDDGTSPSRVIVLDLDRDERVASHLVNGGVELGWHGDTLLATQLDWRGLYQLRGDLYAWVPGGAWRRLTRGERLAAPAAGGGRIAAIRLVPGGREPVWVDAAGRLAPIALPEPSPTWAKVVPSPDGRLVAGVRHLDGAWDLVVWEPESPDRMRRVTRDAAVEEAPAWSPDGALLFTSDRTGLPQMYRWSAETGRVERLTDDPNGAREGVMPRAGEVVYVTIGARGRAVAAHGVRVQPEAGRQGDRGPLDRAPDVEIREGPFHPWPTLLPRYWLPYGQIGDAGTFLGAITSARDPVGRTAYVVGAAVDLDRGRWMGTASLRFAGLGRPVFDLGVTQEWSQLYAPTGTAFGLRERDAALGVTWSWRRWRWALSVRAAAEYEEDALDPAVVSARAFVGGSVFLAAARTLTPALAISRERGFEVVAGYRRRARLDVDGWSNEGRGRAALYLPSLWRQHVIAVRVAVGATGGPDAAVFEVGGVSGGALPVAAGLSLGSRRSFPVRGYPAALDLGTRAVSATIEYRLPLFYVGHNVASLPVGLTRVSATVFGDLGGAWDEGEPASPDALVSAGAEAVVDATVFYDIGLRWRVGAAVALREAETIPRGRGTVYFALSSDF